MSDPERSHLQWQVPVAHPVDDQPTPPRTTPQDAAVPGAAVPEGAVPEGAVPAGTAAEAGEARPSGRRWRRIARRPTARALRPTARARRRLMAGVAALALLTGGGVGGFALAHADGGAAVVGDGRPDGDGDGAGGRRGG